MMKSEFENLAGREVTNEQYRAIETLYMSSNLEKAEFVKSIRTMLKSIPQPERKKDIKQLKRPLNSSYSLQQSTEQTSHSQLTKLTKS